MTPRSDIIRIYDVSTDVNRFQYLLPDASTFTTVFDGSSRAKTWTPPSVFSLKPTREEPDFMDFGMGGNGAVWAIRPEAFQCAPELHHYLYAAGELLPLNYNGRNFQLLNVTEVLNALDTERTTWDYYDDGTRADIEKPAFRSDRLSEQLFKIPETALSKIYCWEDTLNTADEFKAYVERHGLTGLTFDLIEATSRPS